MCVVTLFGQTYQSPESVVFDKNANRYLVSNASGGYILSRSLSGQLSYFATGLNSPKGMCIHGNIVYVTDVKYVKGYLLSNGGLIMNLYISSANTLNDLVWADGYLYASDLYGDKIYKINTTFKTYSVLVSSGLDTPNGLLDDAAHNRLIVVSYATSQAKIYAVSLNTGTVSTLLTTPYGRLDGITRDEDGNIYVSSWQAGAVIRYDSTFSTSDTFVRPLANPADIYYNKEAKVLAVPIFASNAVEFYNLLSPHIQVTGSLSICPGSTVKLSTSTGSALTYKWIRNGNQINTTPYIFANMAGNYWVEVTNHVGTVISDTVHVTVLNQPPKPSISYTGSLSFCYGDSVILQAPAGYTAYKWSDNDTVQNKIVRNSGIFHLTVYDTNYCASPSSDPVTVTVGPSILKPGITINGNTTFCEGDTLSLSGPSGFNYHWSTGDTAQFIQVTSTAQIYLVISDSAGCYSMHSDTISVHVLHAPPKPVISVNGHTTFCEGDSVELSVPAGYYTYQWIDHDSSFSRIIKKSGFYAVMAIDSNHCSSPWSDTVDIHVYPLPHKPVIQVHGNTSLCHGDSLLLSGPSGHYHYYWFPAGGNSQNVYIRQAGKVSLQVEDSNGCRSPLSDSVEVKVFPLPDKPDIIYLQDTFCEGDTVVVQGPHGYQDYIWSNHNTGMTNLITQSTQLTLQVVDSNGCKSPLSDTVHFVMLPRPPVPMIHELPGDTLYTDLQADYYFWYFNHQLLDEHTSRIKALQKGYYQVVVLVGHCVSDTSNAYYFIPSGRNKLYHELKVYPNPSSGSFIIQLPTREAGSLIYITDAYGKTIKEIKAISPRVEVHGLNQGFYLILLNRKGTLLRTCVVVQ